METYLNPVSGGLLEDDTLRLNRYLAAAKLMLMFQRQLPPGTASSDIHDDHDRAKKLLDKAMSSLAMEFCHLRIWRQFQSLLGAAGSLLGAAAATVPKPHGRVPLLPSLAALVAAQVDSSRLYLRTCPSEVTRHSDACILILSTERSCPLSMALQAS